MTSKELLLQAAIDLAALGYKVFPVPPGTKRSYVNRGMKFGSGENWGMTSDPELIRKYWTRWPNANIGLPTGAGNGIIVIETDKPAAHKNLKVDGEESLKGVEKRLGPLPDTRMAESPSHSKHRFYTHPGPSYKVKNSASELGPGIDTRGDGGMVVAPPSIRKDGVYAWLNDLDIAPLPEAWVTALTEIKDSNVIPFELPADANWAERYAAGGDEPPPTLEQLQAALDNIPNNDVGWEEWNDVAMRMWPAIAALKASDEGYRMFEDWSRQSTKFDRGKTRQKWRLLRSNPPTRYNIRSLFKLSEEEGLTEEAKEWKQAEVIEEINGAQLQFTDRHDILIPYNFWDEYPLPKIPRCVFPELIERFALVLGDIRGSDPAGLAMGGLTACAAAIPDCYRLQVKPLADPSWIEEPRIWVSVVGGVASIKTSTFKSVRAPFLEIDAEMMAEYMRAKAAWDALDDDERKVTEEPHCQHILVGDATPEATQDAMRWSPDGMFNLMDEQGYFFGAMDRYSRGGGADRFFWTQTYEGGYYAVRRSSVKHRNYIIPNCGMTMFGSIQPEVIRKFGDNSSNEGLLQRSLTIMLIESLIDKNVPAPPIQEEFNAFIHRLHKLPREHGSLIKFTREADAVRTRFFNETFKLVKLYSVYNSKLAEHISKWRGMFCRICLILHIVDQIDAIWETDISEDIAERVSHLMLGFLLPHAEAFYLGVLNTSEDTHRLRAVCEFILAHERKEISGRDFQASIRTTRGLKSKDIDEILQQLYYLSWVTPGEKKRSDSTTWLVNPVVHQRYQQQADEARIRKAEMRSQLTKDAEARRKGEYEPGVGGKKRRPYIPP